MASRVENTPSRIRIKSFSFNQVVDGNNGVLNTRCSRTLISSLKWTVGRCRTIIFLFFRGPLLGGEGINLFLVEGVAINAVDSSAVLWFIVADGIVKETDWYAERAMRPEVGALDVLLRNRIDFEIMRKEPNFTAAASCGWQALKLFGELFRPNFSIFQPHNCVCIRGETDRMWRIKVWNREADSWYSKFYLRKEMTRFRMISRIQDNC